MNVRLPDMSPLEKEIFELAKFVSPQTMYSAGLEEYAEKLLIPSQENIDSALERVRGLMEKCGSRGSMAYKFLNSLKCTLEFDEPASEIGTVTEVLSAHLIKEGLNLERFERLMDLLSSFVHASLEKFSKRKNPPTAIRVLTQYQVLGALEILDVIEKQAKDAELTQKSAKLRELIARFGKMFAVEGFTDGQFEEVSEILRKSGPDLGREGFYPKALESGFDYHESPKELERNAISWIDEELPKMQRAARVLSKRLSCKPDPESVIRELKSRPGVTPKESLNVTLKMRPIIQAFVAESMVGINPKYDCTVVETPPYLTAIVPSAAAQGFDLLTDSPKTRYFLTTDERRAPPAGFADLVSTLVHEEFGHCVHFSNTAMHYLATPGILEQLYSLHGGTTSEGLSFQRELEFLDALHRLAGKKSGDYTQAERNYVELTKEFGGFEQTLRELEFETYKMRIIRFLRVVGDSRINSGKQNILDFMKWAERKTGLSGRTVFYQIFPAHEGIFPGYATCYAVVGQDIKAIQKPFRNDPEKLVKFNAHASSMGYPARSIFIKNLKDFAKKLVFKKSRKPNRKKKN